MDTTHQCVDIGITNKISQKKKKKNVEECKTIRVKFFCQLFLYTVIYSITKKITSMNL